MKFIKINISFLIFTFIFSYDRIFFYEGVQTEYHAAIKGEVQGNHI